MVLSNRNNNLDESFVKFLFDFFLDFFLDFLSQSSLGINIQPSLPELYNLL